MPKNTIFISCCTKQEHWVEDRLIPLLKAGGAEVCWYKEQFGAGKNLVGQMDHWQDKTRIHLLILTPDYVDFSNHPHCRREFERSVARDPNFDQGITIPIVLAKCVIPDGIRIPDPLRLHLRDEKKPDDWNKLFVACGIDLGTTGPEWLAARDKVRRKLLDNQSVNLHVIGDDVKWRPMMDDLRREPRFKNLGEVDLGNPTLFPQHKFLAAIARASGTSATISTGEEGLAELGSILERARGASRIGILRFHNIEALSGYKIDFFIALRHWVMEGKRLVLLVQSHKPFAQLVPKEHVLSRITIDTVELRGRP